MHRYIPPVLTSILLSGCLAKQNLPVHILIDESFVIEERSAIEAAINTWNDQAGARLGSKAPIFIIDGHVGMPPLSRVNLTDGLHGIYYADSEKFDPTPRDSSWGYGLHEDILVFIDQMSWSKKDAQGKIVELDPRGTIVPWQLKGTLLHELGHLLGLMHFNHLPGIMNDGVIFFKFFDKINNDIFLQKSDLDEFCLIYDCK